MARVTPIGILITVALLAIYCAYAFWEAVRFHSVIHALAGTIAVVACVGAALLKSWSRFLVYLLAAVFVATWGYSIYDGAQAGYFADKDALWILKALAPGMVMVALSCYCVYAVYRQFRPRGSEPQRADESGSAI